MVILTLIINDNFENVELIDKLKHDIILYTCLEMMNLYV